MTNTDIDNIHLETSTRWTKEQDNILEQNINSSYNHLIELFPNRGIKNILSRINQKFGHRIKKQQEKSRTWTEEDIEFLKENYGKVSSKDLIARLGGAYHSIVEYCRRHGIKGFKDEYGRNQNQRDKPNLEKLWIETPQSFYWMGYLFADGYYHAPLKQVVLASASVDKEHLEEYASFIGAKAKLYSKKGDFCKGFENSDRVAVRVSVADSIFAPKIAEKFDWKLKKTYNPPEVEILNKVLKTKDQFLPFFTGFACGDGYLNKINLNIKIEIHASWIFVLKFFAEKLVEFNISNTPPRLSINKRGYAEFHLCKSGVLKLNEYIQEVNLQVLRRKWDKLNK
jgi:hypothetical protein